MNWKDTALKGKSQLEEEQKRIKHYKELSKMRSEKRKFIKQKTVKNVKYYFKGRSKVYDDVNLEVYDYRMPSTNLGDRYYFIVCKYLNKTKNLRANMLIQFLIDFEGSQFNLSFKYKSDWKFLFFTINSGTEIDYSEEYKYSWHETEKIKCHVNNLGVTSDKLTDEIIKLIEKYEKKFSQR